MARLTRFSTWFIVCLTPLVLSALVLAQDDAPPQPSLRTYPPPWIGFLVMGVLLAMVVAVSLLPSKRGHQD